MTTKRRGTHGMLREIGIGALILCCTAGQAAAQTPLQAVRDSLRAVRESVLVARSVREAMPAVEHAVALAGQEVRSLPTSFVWELPGRQNVPQDVRIMRTIVRTALSNVEAPKMPKQASKDSATTGTTVVTSSGRRLAMYSEARSLYFLGRGDVSGFYMQGYGYLFTVHWPVGSDLPVLVPTRLGAHVDRVRVEEDQYKNQQTESAAWAAQYRQRLSDALRDVIAGYGSTLHRAKPGEAITFIADFGGGDSATVTMTVKAGMLHGSNVEANRAAVRVSRGQSGMSERLHSQLEIMSQIIDASLNPDGSEQIVYSNVWSSAFGGGAAAQYVPGYGVIFRKSARLNTARAFMTMSRSSLREQALDSAEVGARKTYRTHLDSLKSKTVRILATYGPTLTGLKDDDWVGIYYDVGSAAGLLTGGRDNYLVQARMRDIRQAAAQSDPAGWLASHIVTNEKGD